MTFDEAVRQHEIDVAAFEIWDLAGQLENLRKWLAQVTEEAEQERCQKALAMLRERQAG